MTTILKDPHFQAVQAWTETMRPHWIRCAGDVFNDKDFWHECIHAVKPQTWLDWCELYGKLQDQWPSVLSKYTYVYEDTCELAKRMSQNKRTTIPYNKTGYNKPVFRLAMAIKDIIGDITHTPLGVRAKTKPSKQEIMDQLEKVEQMVLELFE